MRSLLALSLFIAVLFASLQNARAASPPDANLYTSYSFSNSLQQVNWLVCGSVPGSEGCYGSGSLGPFGSVGSLMEGNPQVLNASAVTRTIYVVDTYSPKNGKVVLNVFNKTEVIGNAQATFSIVLERTVILPLVGGQGVPAVMAANKGYLYIGTTWSTNAAFVDKQFYFPSPLGGFSPPCNVSSITADTYSFVTVTFGSSVGNGGTYIYSPTGEMVADGGLITYMLNAQNGLTPASLEL